MELVRLFPIIVNSVKAFYVINYSLLCPSSYSTLTIFYTIRSAVFLYRKYQKRKELKEPVIVREPPASIGTEASRT